MYEVLGFGRNNNRAPNSKILYEKHKSVQATFKLLKTRTLNE
jgi:hypothetical protein